MILIIHCTDGAKHNLKQINVTGNLKHTFLNQEETNL